MRWEDNIFGKVAQQDWLDIGSVVPTRQADPIDGLFGDERTDNIVAYWESIASEYQVPMMAMFHGFDTEARKTFRVPIDSHNVEKGLIKVKINQSERLRELAKRGVQGDEALYRWVLNDGLRLADQVITRTKVAKNEVMATGKVTIKENDVDLIVDYGVPSAQTALSINLHAQADILAQIQTIIDMAADNGQVISGMMTSRANISKMRKNESVQKAINGNIGAGALVRATAFEAFLNEEFGIGQIITNDLKYGASATEGDRPVITQARYYPENKITFFVTNPAGRVGTGLWGDPPEADNFGLLNVSGSGISPYVYITQWMTPDPAELWTKASSLFMPVLYNPNSLFIATTSETQPA